MMVDMKRTNVFLTERQRQQLALLKAKTGVPVAEQIRRAVNAYLKACKGK